MPNAYIRCQTPTGDGSAGPEGPRTGQNGAKSSLGGVGSIRVERNSYSSLRSPLWTGLFWAEDGCSRSGPVHPCRRDRSGLKTAVLGVVAESRGQDARRRSSGYGSYAVQEWRVPITDHDRAHRVRRVRRLSCFAGERLLPDSGSRVSPWKAFERRVRVPRNGRAGTRWAYPCFV